MARYDRRRELEAEYEAKRLAEMAERERKLSLDLWSAIEECDASQDVKDILHRIANGERQEV